MELLLCNTNLSVTKVVTLINSNPDESFIVLTDQGNILKTIELIGFENSKIIFLKSVFSFFDIDIYRTIKLVQDLFLKNDIKRVRIYHQAYGGFFNWIVSYAHKLEIVIEYNRVVRELFYPKAKLSVSSLKLKLKYKILYKTNVDILNRGNGNLMPKLSKSFYVSNEITERIFSEDEKIIQDVSKKIIVKLGLSLKKDSIVLLTGSVMSTKQISIAEYENRIIELIDSLGRNNILCKCHPRFTDETELEKSLPHIPSYIPIEFLRPYYNVFIGYNSTVLIQAAIDGKIAISLLKYFKPISFDRRDKWFLYFDGYDVLFPENIKDIIEYKL